jgi:hypothetical protein
MSQPCVELPLPKEGFGPALQEKKAHDDEGPGCDSSTSSTPLFTNGPETG